MLLLPKQRHEKKLCWEVSCVTRTIHFAQTKKFASGSLSKVYWLARSDFHDKPRVSGSTIFEVKKLEKNTKSKSL